MQTVKQISKEYNISASKIYRRTYVLKIEPRRDGINTLYSSEQVYDIVTYLPPEKSFKNNRRKLTIIEFYQKHGSGNKVAHILNIERKFVQSAIREWKETGCCVVESKMNKALK